MTPYEIPLTAEPQQFQISLVKAVYSITVRWCTASVCWVMDIADAGSTPLVQGVPLLPGVDILGQYKHLGIGGQLFVQSDVDLNKVPDFASLGTSSHLYLLVP